MLLHLCTWQEVESYLERSTAIFLPIGSTEQHGPNGLIGTDSICPEIIAKGVMEQLGVLIGPTLNIGMSQHHLGFAGSITLKPTTLIAVVQDVVQSLAKHGFDRFYFLNGHGGNIAPVNSAFSEIHAQTSMSRKLDDHRSLKCRLYNWWMGHEVGALSKKLFGKSEGMHATPSEVSLTYYAYPDAVKNVEINPRIAPIGAIRDAEDYRQQFPDGRIGSDPSLASVEAGKKVYEAALKDVIGDYQHFIG